MDPQSHIEAAAMGAPQLQQANGALPQAAFPPLPPSVARLLNELYRCLAMKDLQGVQRLYQVDYRMLSDEEFAHQPLPHFQAATEFYSRQKLAHPILDILYRELYYRHLFGIGREKLISWEDRELALSNYSLMLEYLAGSECVAEEKLMLPPLWIHEMVEELIYQHQDSQMAGWKILAEQSRLFGHQQPQPTAELDPLHAEGDGDTAALLTKLYAIISASKIIDTLRRWAAVPTAEEQGGPPPLGYVDQIGYIACCAVLRVSNYTANYQSGLEAVKLIPDAVFAADALPFCASTFVYNKAFALMMTGQYAQAMQVACGYLTQGDRMKASYSTQQQLHGRLQVRDTTDKRLDRLYLVVMLCCVFTPEAALQIVDDSVLTYIKEHHGSRMARLPQDDAVVADIFKRASPKFISPVACHPNLKLDVIRREQPAQIMSDQLSLFARNFAVQRRVSQMFSFAKMYKNISIARLAAVSTSPLDLAPEETREMKIRSGFMCVKSASRAEATNGNAGSGAATVSGLGGGSAQAAEAAGKGSSSMPGRPHHHNVASDILSARSVDFVLDETLVHVWLREKKTIFIDNYLDQLDKVKDLLALGKKFQGPAPLIQKC